ncbi:MAG: hypothetical protein IT424_02745, partial [Pirellulales bacterium]|nr:hypothetical protein [Pirellulales bacterium]
MERVSFFRHVIGQLVARRRTLQWLLLIVLGAWSLPSLAEDAAIGGHTQADEVAPADIDASRVNWEGISKAAIVIAVLVVPMIVGSFLARRLRMPDYGWKFSLAIGSLAAAAVILMMGEIKKGPDLSGGITLIYEIENNPAAAPAGAAAAQPGGDQAQAGGGDQDTGQAAADAD